MPPSTKRGPKSFEERYLADVRRRLERHDTALAGARRTARLPEAAPLRPEAMAGLRAAGDLWADFVARLARAGIHPPVSFPVPDPRTPARGSEARRPRSDASGPPEEETAEEVARQLADYFLEASLVMAGRLLEAPAREPQSLDPEAELPEAEAEVLRSVGARFLPLGEGDEDPELAYEAGYARLLATALDTKGAAGRLGISDGYVRQRLEAGTLYGVKLGRAWRLPLFQFAEAGEVPGIARVLPLIDPALNPVAVERWFGLPKPELHNKDLGRDLSPREWLLSGHDPGPLEPLAEAL
jgi:excisionase family DNA binding protein